MPDVCNSNVREAHTTMGFHFIGYRVVGDDASSTGVAEIWSDAACPLEKRPDKSERNTGDSSRGDKGGVGMILLTALTPSMMVLLDIDKFD